SFMAEYSKSLTSVGIGTASSVHLLNLIMNHYPHGQRNCGGPSCRLVDTFDNLWCGCARCEIFTFQRICKRKRVWRRCSSNVNNWVCHTTQRIYAYSFSTLVHKRRPYHCWN